MVESVQFLIHGDGIVVQASLVHFDWPDIHSEAKGELLLVGGVDFGEDVHCLVESPEGYLLEVVGDAEFWDSDLVSD